MQQPQCVGTGHETIFARRRRGPAPVRLLGRQQRFPNHDIEITRAETHRRNQMPRLGQRPEIFVRRRRAPIPVRHGERFMVCVQPPHRCLIAANPRRRQRSADSGFLVLQHDRECTRPRCGAKPVAKSFLAKSLRGRRVVSKAPVGILGQREKRLCLTPGRGGNRLAPLPLLNIPQRLQRQRGVPRVGHLAATMPGPTAIFVLGSEQCLQFFRAQRGVRLAQPGKKANPQRAGIGTFGRDLRKAPQQRLDRRVVSGNARFQQRQRRQRLGPRFRLAVMDRADLPIRCHLGPQKCNRPGLRAVESKVVQLATGHGDPARNRAPRRNKHQNPRLFHRNPHHVHLTERSIFHRVKNNRHAQAPAIFFGVSQTRKGAIALQRTTPVVSAV